MGHAVKTLPESEEEQDKDNKDQDIATADEVLYTLNVNYSGAGMHSQSWRLHRKM